MEWGIGRRGGRKGFHSAPAILGVWGRGSFARYLGAFGVLVPMVVYFYYVIIESWCLGYTWSYLSGGIGSAAGRRLRAATHGPFDGAFVTAAVFGGNRVESSSAKRRSPWLARLACEGRVCW